MMRFCDGGLYFQAMSSGQSYRKKTVLNYCTLIYVKMKK